MSSKSIVSAGIIAIVLGFNYVYLPNLLPYVSGILIVKPPPVLNPQLWKQFPLKEKIKISHNTALYRFAFSHPKDVLGLPIGQHISVQAEINGKLVQRSYTPTSSDDDLEKITVKGPKGQFKYRPGLVKALGMIAGGTGITPMLQIIRAICKNPKDKTKVNLVFANVTEDDILLKDELDTLAAQHDNFNVYYSLDKPSQNWVGGTGFITPEIIQKYCPKPANDIKILLCGPLPMVNAMAKNCELLGYEKARSLSKLEDQVFKF
ncbi:7353_t:CDS:2 [Diversispora eburnea]|uniref:7353_t:CDS:1 n=1 Tax=Diversispora eburnea TaxID=1213867 RepID=A0A9N8V2J8_9GLOM|nr:7353_t:CDS:2 [Diversispora eburnea]